MLVRTPQHCHLRDRLRTPFCSLKMICTQAFPTYYVSNVVTALKKQSKCTFYRSRQDSNLRGETPMDF